MRRGVRKVFSRFLRNLLLLAGFECWVPVGPVGRSSDVVLQLHNSVQLLLVQTGTVGSVLVPPAEPEAGRGGGLDQRWAGGQLLKTDLKLLRCSCRDSGGQFCEGC